VSSLAVLSNAWRRIELCDFARVKATCSSGTDTKRVVPELDYLLTTIGDWIDL
jgi:hypothetical protein